MLSGNGCFGTNPNASWGARTGESRRSLRRQRGAGASRGPAMDAIVGPAKVARSRSAHSDRADGSVGATARRRKGSSLGRRYCRSSWANARATLTARSLARCRNPIVSKHVVRLLDYTALANGDRCRRLLSPELSSLDAARRRTYARAQTGSEKPPAGFVLYSP